VPQTRQSVSAILISSLFSKEVEMIQGLQQAMCKTAEMCYSITTLYTAVKHKLYINKTDHSHKNQLNLLTLLSTHIHCTDNL